MKYLFILMMVASCGDIPDDVKSKDKLIKQLRADIWRKEVELQKCRGCELRMCGWFPCWKCGHR